MKEVQELDIYVHSASLMHNYWIALCVVLVTAGGGILAVLACWYRRCRQNGTYAYTALEPETNVQERLELEKKARDRAQNMCIQHLSPRYSFIDQLNDIGSRVTKHWFIVRDSSVKTERLLTFVPRGPNCPIQFGPETRSVFLDLFLALQHPYIYPILDMNFKEIGNKWYIFATLPFNEKGSLKDFIYKSRWQDNWSQKYSQRSSGLPLSQVQRLGRQILEALLFLKKRGFPPCGHLHSGNVILQNGVARLTGLENTLLGYTSRIQPIIWSRAQSEPSAVDSLCFGHVLFEMCAGYELDTAQPTPGNLLDLHQYPQVVEVLDFIFENPEMKLPTIEELLLCDLFRNIDLREMRNQAQSTQVFKSSLTPMAVELLNDVKKFQSGRRRMRNQPEASPEAESSNSSQRERSISSGGSEAEADDEDAYDADANSEPEIIPNKEHRCLSLHNGSSNRIINFHPADMR